MTYHIPTALPPRPHIHPVVWFPWFGGLLSICFGIYRFNTLVPPYTGSITSLRLVPKGFLAFGATILCIILVVVSVVTFWTRYRRNTWRIMTGLLIGIAMLFFWIAVNIPHHLPWFIESPLYQRNPAWIQAAESSPWLILGGAGSLLGASFLILVMRLVGKKDEHGSVKPDAQQASNVATVIIYDRPPLSSTANDNSEGES